MLFVIRPVASRLLSIQFPRSVGGSCSWMNTTVPAVVRSGEAGAAGPSTRLAQTASAPIESAIEGLLIRRAVLCTCTIIRFSDGANGQA